MSGRFAFLLLLLSACTPVDAKMPAPPPASPWLLASDIRVDVCEDRHRMTIEGRQLVIDGDLNLQINDDVSIEAKGDVPFSATADTVFVTKKNIALEGHVETRFQGNGPP